MRLYIYDESIQHKTHTHTLMYSPHASYSGNWIGCSHFANCHVIRLQFDLVIFNAKNQWMHEETKAAANFHSKFKFDRIHETLAHSHTHKMLTCSIHCFKCPWISTPIVYCMRMAVALGTILQRIGTIEKASLKTKPTEPQWGYWYFLWECECASSCISLFRLGKHFCSIHTQQHCNQAIYVVLNCFFFTSSSSASIAHLRLLI